MSDPDLSRAAGGECAAADAGALDRVELLRSHPLFSRMPVKAAKRFLSFAVLRSVPAGTTIFVKGDPGSSLIAVLAGAVKISVPARDGREAVLKVIYAGEIVGELAVLDGRPRSASATAMVPCELMVIERRDFIPFLREQPDVAFGVIEILCTRLRDTSEQVEHLMFLDLAGRLAKALLRLADGAAGAGGRVAITQRVIGQTIGMSRESTNKQLRDWQRNGWVRLGRGGIVLLAPDKLAAVAAGRRPAPNRTR